MKIVDKTLLNAFGALSWQEKDALSVMLTCGRGLLTKREELLMLGALRKIKRRLKESAREKGRRS